MVYQKRPKTNQEGNVDGQSEIQRSMLDKRKEINRWTKVAKGKGTTDRSKQPGSERGRRGPASSVVNWPLQSNRS